jgi:hypothetical protein
MLGVYFEICEGTLQHRDDVVGLSQREQTPTGTDVQGEGMYRRLDHA